MYKTVHLTGGLLHWCLQASDYNGADRPHKPQQNPHKYSHIHEQIRRFYNK